MVPGTSWPLGIGATHTTAVSSPKKVLLDAGWGSEHSEIRATLAAVAHTQCMYYVLRYTGVSSYSEKGGEYCRLELSVVPEPILGR